jgi:hypothetical protein
MSGGARKSMPSWRGVGDMHDDTTERWEALVELNHCREAAWQAVVRGNDQAFDVIASIDRDRSQLLKEAHDAGQDEVTAHAA